MLGQSAKDANKWQEMADRLQSENQSQRATIDDLEIKNRLLNDKLHAQIYQ